jgi:gluconate 2-dehydrogenase gamma chain
MTRTQKPDPTPAIGPDEPHVSRRLFLKSSGAAIASTGVAVPVAAHQATPESTPAAPGATPAAADVQPLSPPAIEFFNPYEAAMVEALTARILPGTPDDPGAREAGVIYYIDRVLAGPDGGYAVKTYRQGPFLVVSEGETSVERTSRTDIYRVVETAPRDDVSRYGYQSVLTPQEIYRRGLASVDAYARSAHGAAFLDLGEDQQDAVLETMEADEATEFDAPGGNAFFTKLRNDTIEGMFSDPIYGGNRDMAGWRLIGYPGARGFYTAQEMADGSFSADPVSLADAEGHSH